MVLILGAEMYNDNCPTWSLASAKDFAHVIKRQVFYCHLHCGLFTSSPVHLPCKSFSILKKNDLLQIRWSYSTESICYVLLVYQSVSLIMYMGDVIAWYDLRKYSFSDRVVNTWNGLHNYIVLSDTTDQFKNSRFHPPAVCTNWPSCVDVPLNTNQIN